MKKLISTITVVLILIVSTAFCAGAQSFVYENISMDIPGDVSLAPDDVSEFYGTTKLWMTADDNFYIDLDVKINDDDYVYADYSQNDFESFFEGYVEGSDFEQNATLENAENITAGSMNGIRLDMRYDDGEEIYTHTLCVFSSQSKIYALYFEVYDESYTQYVDSIIGSLEISDTTYIPEREINTNAIARIIAFAVIAPIIRFIKKKNDQKKAAKAQTQQQYEHHQPAGDDSADENTTEPGYDSLPEIIRDEAPDNGFAAKEAERERKEREKMFD